jgi:hypothetical protein
MGLAVQIRLLESDVGPPTVGRSRCGRARTEVVLLFRRCPPNGDCWQLAITALQAEMAALYRGMRSRFIWFMPVLLLIFLIGSATAYAHAQPSAGLEASTGEPQTLDEGVQSDIQVSAASADESGAPCDCPGGHCTCNVDCLAMCATTVAFIDTIAFDFSPAGSVIPLEKMKFSIGWTPNRDFDPPRRTA